jgi:hypothetical protein
VPLLAIAIGSLPLLALELARNDLPRSDRVLLDVVNLAVLASFAIDYLVEFLFSAPPRAQYVRNEWTSLLIVLAQAAAVLPGLAGFGVLRLLRGARVIRSFAVVLRMVAIGGSAAREGVGGLGHRSEGLAATASESPASSQGSRATSSSKGCRRE